MRTDKLLFSESSGFVLEAKAGQRGRAGGAPEKLRPGADADRHGNKQEKDSDEEAGEAVVDLDLEEARKAWTTGLAEAMR